MDELNEIGFVSTLADADEPNRDGCEGMSIFASVLLTAPEEPSERGPGAGTADLGPFDAKGTAADGTNKTVDSSGLLSHILEVENVSK